MKMMVNLYLWYMEFPMLIISITKTQGIGCCKVIERNMLDLIEEGIKNLDFEKMKRMPITDTGRIKIYTNS